MCLVQKGSLNAELLSGVQTAEVVLRVVVEFDKSFVQLLAHPRAVAPRCFSRVDPSGGPQPVSHCAPLSSHAEQLGILGLSVPFLLCCFPAAKPFRPLFSSEQ